MANVESYISTQTNLCKSISVGNLFHLLLKHFAVCVSKLNYYFIYFVEFNQIIVCFDFRRCFTQTMPKQIVRSIINDVQGITND